MALIMFATYRTDVESINREPHMDTATNILGNERIKARWLSLSGQPGY